MESKTNIYTENRWMVAGVGCEMGEEGQSCPANTGSVPPGSWARLPCAVEWPAHSRPAVLRLSKYQHNSLELSESHKALLTCPSHIGLRPLPFQTFFPKGAGQEVCLRGTRRNLLGKAGVGREGHSGLSDMALRGSRSCAARGRKGELPRVVR